MSALVLTVVYFVSNGDEAKDIKIVQTAKDVSQTAPIGDQEPEKDVDGLPTKAVLEVAFMSEAPDGNWTHPWSNACEETVTLMADRFYAGAKFIGIGEAKSYLQNLFDKEEALLGTNRNSDASEMLQIIDQYAGFKGKIVRNPSLADIKREIAEGRPVITLHYGFDLKNPNIGFSPTLSSYHTVLVIGYDDNRRVFITHDPGDEVHGDGYEYGYSLFMKSLHDYNRSDNKADGPATAIFTSAK